MRSKTEIRLTPGQRLSRGLKYSAVGPVDVTRGALGLGVDGAQSSAAWVGDRYRRSRLKDQLGKELAAAQDTIASELAAAQEVVSNLPQRCKRRAPGGAGVRCCWPRSVWRCWPGERWRSRSSDGLRRTEPPTAAAERAGGATAVIASKLGGRVGHRRGTSDSAVWNDAATTPARVIGVRALISRRAPGEFEILMQTAAGARFTEDRRPSTFRGRSAYWRYAPACYLAR